MKKIFCVVILGALLSFSLGCFSSQAQKDFKGESAPDFTLKDLKGNSFKLSDFSGKIIILNFFATWCPPCRSEMPDFNQIQKANPDTVKIVAVNVGGENVNQVSNFVSQLGLEFMVARDDGKVANMYGPIRAIPVTFVIDKNMNVQKHYIGARPKEVFEKDIEELR